jgi:SagB-type dehydrogenase family enzyme
MTQNGCLAYVAASDSGALASTSATKFFDRASQPEPAARYVLSRFAFIRRDGARTVIDSARSAIQITIHDPRVLPLITTLTTPRRIADLGEPNSALSDEEIAVLASLFLGCNVLVEAGDGGHSVEDEGALAYWNFHDLLFHSRSRMGRHHGGYGATFPFRGRAEPAPVIKPAMSGEIVELETADIERLRQDDVPFTAVVEDRRTIREYGDPPLHRRQLGEFLYRVARDRRSPRSDSGMERGSRPYPGGGAVYELEIYLSVHACAELPSGLYHYRPAEHCLSRLPARPDLVAALLRKAVQIPEMVPQILFTITARFPRVFWKYESMAYALILKDVGVLYQTMYLAAEAMGLGACALGGGDSDLFAATADIDFYAESSVGEFVIGSRAEKQS